MNSIVVHHDHDWLLESPHNGIAVQAYKTSSFRTRGTSIAGSPLPNAIRRLGVFISPPAMDFLTIALGVIAADTFIRRSEAADRWTRMINLKIALQEPERWKLVQKKLEQAFRFLSGDIWRLEFMSGGYSSPTPMKRKGNAKLIECGGLDCVSLFSGGLDSAIGAIDLLSDGRKPLLVSHSYRGDKKAQGLVASSLAGDFARFSTSIYPRWGGEGTTTDVSMRTRSLSFLAFAVVGADALQTINNLSQVEIFIPENGFISLNIPLTVRRIGSLSTRTTHPYFVSLIQSIFNDVGIHALLKNPYQFKTKGEMAQECANSNILKGLTQHTISCGKWKRKNKPCGRCIPCIIRRASLYKANIKDSDLYEGLNHVMNDEECRDDLISISAAIVRQKETPGKINILKNGPLPPEHLQDYRNVFFRGLSEVEAFLHSENVI